MRNASATVNATVRSVRKTGRNVRRPFLVTENSVDTTRNSESERLDFCPEGFPLGGAHEIRALHRADRGAQRAETGVLERLARREQRLFAHHARPFHPLHIAVGVGDDPLAADELAGLAADVRDPHAVGEEIVVLARLAPLFDVHALYFDADAPGGGIAHLRGNGTACVSSQLSAVSSQLSAVSSQLSAVSCQL